MLTISQVAAYAGVTVRAVRHYHQIGLLLLEHDEQLLRIGKGGNPARVRVLGQCFRAGAHQPRREAGPHRHRQIGRHGHSPQT